MTMTMAMAMYTGLFEFSLATENGFNPAQDIYCLDLLSKWLSSFISWTGGNLENFPLFQCLQNCVTVMSLPLMRGSLG